MIVVLGSGSFVDYFKKFGEVTTDWKNVHWDDVELVVFTGGADVDPSLYRETMEVRTHSDLARDLFEKMFYKACRTYVVPMVGICRGAQFLTVMNGGKLKQHRLLYRQQRRT